MSNIITYFITNIIVMFESFIDNFVANPAVLIVDYPVATYGYVTGNLEAGGVVYENLNFYCVDVNNALEAQVYQDSAKVYSFNEVVNNPSLAPNIAVPSRLNQVAWVISNINVGYNVATPQTWDGVTYTDNGPITSSDIQAAIWALVSTNGECDSPTNLCTISLNPVSIANVAYIVSSALSSVPDGTTYYPPSAGGYYPVVVIPSDTTQVLITFWQTGCEYPTHSPTVVPTVVPTLAPTCECAYNFIESFSEAFSNFLISVPLGSDSFVTATAVADGVTYDGLETWCVDYEHVIFSLTDYNNTVAYPYTEVIANPSLAPNIVQPLRLNQIAWILENIAVGTPVSSPQSWFGISYSDTGDITVSDIQAAIWAIIEPAGTCDQPTNLCNDDLSTILVGNVAYIYNTAFSAVPDGSSYVIPGSSSYVPVIAYSGSNRQTLIINWSTNCNC
eukprot:CAMPEP_0196764506 /NCGR_PEP_ID=MMETSP1095-20130614/6324_1 /TAXON_ID=96789 ORGANISM="Chromulina nebulosa, Strain UTEXLB2642" /NCGR_SAMPLE_ID=MMETSP1095 /ASSEMBLY_ACC=CAM_ASM_000446 /LENGTH=446 /DNA_ID=CAMNT_0042120315 /DNA_START=157 /DNA_END=1498 /DNA_ORIENTATION=-